ncbi:guanylate kinase [bacterium]|jgi:guanylate kinase|nr:guanylate kinase [bacterium]
MSPAESHLPTRPGGLIVVSGPSGSGKSTLVHQLLADADFPIRFSVSATSRPPRPGEVEGVDYFFVSADRFEAMRQAGELLESASVHGNLYGTPRGPIEEAIRSGQWILLEIDVQGYRQIKNLLPGAVGFFIRAGSRDTYADRLKQRNTESDEQLQTRLDNVAVELQSASEYDFQIVNDDIQQALRTWKTLLRGLANR